MLPIIKWAIYYLLLLIGYTLQTIPGLFSVMGIRPIIVLPLVICVAMFEEVMPSVIYAVIGGLLWDISSDKLFGFNAIILLACAMLVSLICIYYLRTKLVNSIIFVTITVLLQSFLNYTFYYALWGEANKAGVLIGIILPMALYTVIISPIVYWIVKSVAVRFHAVVRA